MKADNFFAELKRRNVYKVAVAYVVAGWARTRVSEVWNDADTTVTTPTGLETR